MIRDRFVFSFIDYLLAGKKNMAIQLLINTISAGENSKVREMFSHLRR